MHLHRLVQVRLALVALIALIATAIGLGSQISPAVANPQGTNLVINEVYGGGGNSGSTLTNDFVELYNPTSTSINLGGYTVQYSSYKGSSGGPGTPLCGSIPAHGYYLVQEAKGAGGTQALPTPDAAGSLNLSSSSGEVALVDGSAIATGPTSAGVVDFVGYGAAPSATNPAQAFEGAGPAPTLSNTTSDSRTNGTDTDSNSADFTAGSPTPTNSAGSTTSGSGTTPPA